MIIRRQKFKNSINESNLDYFLTTRKTKNLHTIEKGESDHLMLVADIYIYI